MSQLESQCVERRSSLTAVVMCVHFERGKIAAACYDEASKTVHHLNDTVEDDDFNTLKYLVDRIKPTQVICNANCRKEFRKAIQVTLNCFVDDTFVKPLAEESDTNTMDSDVSKTLLVSRVSDNPSETNVDNDTGLWTCSLKFLSGHIFRREEGFKWLSRMLDYDGRDVHVRTKMIFDANESVLIGAIGALLMFINQVRVGIEFDDPSELVPIETFKTIILGDILLVDQVSRKALAVFDDSLKTKVSRCKSGVRIVSSLFDLCNHCKCAPGRKKLRFWFSRPLRSRNILKKRHEAIMFFSQEVNAKLTSYIRSCLKHVHSVATIFTKVDRGKISVKEWISLTETVKALVDIGDSLRACEVDLGALGPGEKALSVDLARISELLKKTFDKTESLEESRFVVHAGVSAELDHLKAQYAHLSSQLTETAQSEIRTYDIPECSVCYLPIIGYMVMVPPGVGESITHAAFERVYSTNTYVGFKTPGMHELDRVYGDIRSSIIDKETTITNGIQELLSSRRRTVLDAIEVAANLDCLISLTVTAVENEWVRPRFIDEAKFCIEEARQPLVDQGQGVYVPNNVMSGHSDFGLDKVKLIAGPNASGKSVYLKMVGAIAYLAHVGSYVPAKKAELGPLSQIITRMYTVDSVLDGLSSFASDLRQMSNAIKKAGEHSLVIIDEFGKGTLTEVGIGLLAGCLNFWLDKPEQCPHVFLATHFCSLRCFLRSSELLADYKMGVTNDSIRGIQFTYKLEKGQSTRSYASFTARNVGVPQEIVVRADEVYENLKQGKSLCEIDGQNAEEEAKITKLVEQMEDLLGEFLAFDSTDTRGLLAQVRDRLSVCSTSRTT